MKADKGTPELQEKRGLAEKMFQDAVAMGNDKIGGLEYLHARGTIDQGHLSHGRMFARWCDSFHRKHSVRCSLANLSTSEGGEAEEPSEYQQWIASIMDNAQWFSEVSGRLTQISHKAKRPYARIVLMVSVYGWNLKHVAAEGGKYRKDGKPINPRTAASWTKHAFDSLCQVVLEIENEHQRKMNCKTT